MRIELTMDGGFAHFPDLAKPFIVDESQLPAVDAAELRRLCSAALGAARRTPPPLLAALPDARRYHLTVDHDGARHEIITADPVDQPAVAALIAFVTNVSRP